MSETDIGEQVQHRGGVTGLSQAGVEERQAAAHDQLAVSWDWTVVALILTH